ncbi:MAG: hypothetical protein ACYCSO_08375 [Cuniculiplasma sp.]
MGISEVKKELSTFAVNWWVSGTFFFFYIIVNRILFELNGGRYPISNIATFLTSWFNPMEDFTRLYGNGYI